MNNSQQTRDIARGIYLWACLQDLPLAQAENPECIERKAWNDYVKNHSRSIIAIVQKEQFDLFDRVLRGYTIEWTTNQAPNEIVKVHYK